MTFDTLAVATELKQAGFPPEQAEALARAWSHVASSDLATKADLLGVKSDLEQKISGVKSDLEQKISGVKSDLEKEIGDLRSDMKTLRWMIGFSLGLLVLIIGKLFVVPH
jgi:hypothetical protein